MIYETLLFTGVEDSNTAAGDMNNYLELKRPWAYDWRMSFNPDPQKQAVELIFFTNEYINTQQLASNQDFSFFGANGKIFLNSQENQEN